ncbi:aromatic prenyltransferase [Aspergillus udagawae]|uniref:Aromatic prenyltransferase n=1 Tax=Aspergillus udagawae TaxID=91492 RepID=A0A8E0R0K2_9EURO|nr:aromatic prenyltransferase [Aspergillus udagawae]GIC93735.1 aromatic prenyltransferase [Aspergillus udagawae]
MEVGQSGGIQTGLLQHMSEKEKKGPFEDPALGPQFKSPQQGAATTVWGAVSRALEGLGGVYLEVVQIAKAWDEEEGQWAPGYHKYLLEYVLNPKKASSRRLRTMAIDTPYETLTPSFDFPTEDQQLWWHHIAPVFIKSMTDANYTSDAQHKQLTFFYRCVLPHLGQFPVNSGNKPSNQAYKSNLGPYGLPFEFSLNFPDPIVRYSYEPIGPRAGTMDDPFNVEQIWPALKALLSFDESVDATLFHELVDLLLLSKDDAKTLTSQPGFTPGGPARGQCQFGVDMQGDQPMLKGYFFTAMKSLATGIRADKLICDAIRAVDRGGQRSAPLAELESYLQARAAEPESTFFTAYLGCDIVPPEQARLKVYGVDREVTFERLIDLWTLGGRLPNDVGGQAEGLRALREMWDLLQIPSGIRDMKVDHLTLGEPPKSLLPFIVNYTLLPGSLHPVPQLYLVPFGLPDVHIAAALTRFFERMGWDQIAKTYKQNIVSY